jgi:hypothetical protein
MSDTPTRSAGDDPAEGDDRPDAEHDAIETDTVNDDGVNADGVNEVERRYGADENPS